MSILTFAKSQLGPIIEVTAAPSIAALEELKKAGRPVPAPKQFKMLVDTGAETSALEESLATSFGVPYVSLGWARTMNGVRPARKYDITFTLTGANGVSWISGPVEVLARHDAFVGAPYAGLIGRDILDRALFICNGPGHHCTLTF